MKKKIKKILKAILFVLTIAAIGFACYAQITVAGENLLTYPTRWGFFLARSYRWFTLGAIVLGVISIAVLWVGVVRRRRAARQARQQAKAGEPPVDHAKIAGKPQPVSVPPEDLQPEGKPLREADPKPAETKAEAVPAVQPQPELIGTPEEEEPKKPDAGLSAASPSEEEKEGTLYQEPVKLLAANCSEVSQEEAPAAIPHQEQDTEPTIPAPVSIQEDTPRTAEPKTDSAPVKSQSEQDAPASVQPEARFCKRCGEPRIPGARFCKKCGYRF